VHHKRELNGHGMRHRFDCMERITKLFCVSIGILITFLSGGARGCEIVLSHWSPTCRL